MNQILTGHYDATIALQSHLSQPNIADGLNLRDFSLVQIYPTNIVDGLVRIDIDCFTIGRDADNDLSLSDGNVSRYHAELESLNDQYLLRDLGSTNGTFVDDQPITEVVLRGGEIIRFGSCLFKFLAANGIEAQYHSTVYNAMTRDGMTGAYNKSYLLDTLEREHSRALRCQKPLSVLLMDLDRFKSINDTYGHLVGDEVLREFSRRVQATVRSDDLFCRYGGEEFVLILCETSLAEAKTIAEQCRRVVAETPFVISGGELEVTVSLGAACLSHCAPEITPQELLKRADEGLYQAKQSGRNRVACVSQ